MRRIIPRSVTYGFTTSSDSRAPSSSPAIAVVIGRYLPGALCRTTAGSQKGRVLIAKFSKRDMETLREPLEAGRLAPVIGRPIALDEFPKP